MIRLGNYRCKPPIMPPKPNEGTNRNGRLSVDVSIKDIEIFESLVSVFTLIITDERIDKEVRQSYLDEFISNI